MRPIQRTLAGVALGLAVAVPVLTVADAVAPGGPPATSRVVAAAPATGPDTSSTPSPAPAGPLTVVGTGTVVRTDYGPVQVEVTVTGGRITAARALQLPAGGESDQINRRAEPLLSRQVLDRQGAGIDTVSGATYTSQGYRTSLQAALDAARAAATTSGGSA
ncbi:FMN-binding protein [Pseudonocardia hydrocarbonoxydans]|uniref:FMN-binding protein n=1 Tax=Pseudonocardia hydrocarbonoxydans TaxID=76726 RepID=UPI001C3F92A7|nr:FMN-binding protein [Pseudonocardia hydrocarbonoxydans]